MGIERERFVGNPHKQEYIDEDEELEYMSEDEIEINPFVLQFGDPDIMIAPEIVSDTDEDYNPEDDYEDFLSDSDFVVDETDESGAEIDFSASEPEDDQTQETTTNKINGDTKSTENKVNSEAKTNNGVGDVSSNNTADTDNP